MLYVVSPIELNNYGGQVLVYDTSDKTCELHTGNEVFATKKSGVKFGNVKVSGNSMRIEPMYVEDIFSSYKMAGVKVRTIYSEDVGNVYIITDGSGFLIFSVVSAYRVDLLAMDPDSHFDCTLTPPIKNNGVLGFYLGYSVPCSNTVQYEWNAFTNSSFVMNNPDSCNYLKNMLSSAKTVADEQKILQWLGCY